MWLSGKTAGIGAGEKNSEIGTVSVGGLRPAVVTDGESRAAELLALGGGVYVPKAGDEVLLERTAMEDKVVLGIVASDSLQGVEAGELVICLPGGEGRIHFKNNGEIELSGNLVLKGNTEITGELTINGEPFVSR